MESKSDIEAAEHQSVRDDEEKGATERKMEGEESRKAGKPSSRIPTFQSSLARKRTTPQIAEAPVPVKAEGSMPESQSKEGEPSITKLPTFGDKEMSLNNLPCQMHSSSTDDLSSVGSLDSLTARTFEATSVLFREDHSPDSKTQTAGDSEMADESLKRPSIRPGTDMVSEPLVEDESANTKTVSDDRQSLDDQLDGLTQQTSECLHIFSADLDVKKMSRSLIGDAGEESYDLKRDQPCAASSEETLKDRDLDVPAKAKTAESAFVDHSNVTYTNALDVPAKAKTAESAFVDHSNVNYTNTRRKSIAVFFLLPSVLLLLGGFGQHIWLYGVPRSVSQLMVQLELHWLEGFWMPQEQCSSECRLTLAESIPEGMRFPSGSPHLQTISQTWANLLNRANSSVSIAAFYLTLRDSDIGLTEPSAMQGKELFRQMKELKSKEVDLKIAVNAPQTYRADTDELTETGAEVREVDLQSITGGIVHTKLWVVDTKHMYVGSANMDWRSLTQVKEVGVSVEDCSCLAQDASRIFGIYWEIGAQKNSSLPPYWPGRFSALSSIKYPLIVKFNGVPARVYLSSAPPQLSATGRTDDLSAIISVIADAKEFVYISVMDYLPMSQFTHPIRFWPAIDSVLRDAACARGVEVNLLVSCWSHSPGAMFVFLQSLSVLKKQPLNCNVQVKVFEIPYTQEQGQIPFARVNHAKYMVTDQVVYIGTSNWSQNYFSQTAGVGLVINQTGAALETGQQTVQNQLLGIFQRDWKSDFAQTLTDHHAEYCSGKKHV